MTRYLVEGHAIVSAQGFYADADGAMPDALRFEADWLRFQAALDRAALTVLGRKGHEANPNPKARRRLVVSRRAPAMGGMGAVGTVGTTVHGERGVYWAAPDLPSLRTALAHLVPGAGRIAVVGGTGVFDQFLILGYDAFHLVVANRVRLPGGRPVFSGVRTLEDVATRLRAHGLAITKRLEIDRKNGVCLHLFHRKSPDGD